MSQHVHGEHLEVAIFRALERYERQKACLHKNARRAFPYCPDCGKKLRLSRAEKDELVAKIKSILRDDYYLVPTKDSKSGPHLTRQDRQLLKRMRIQF